MTDAAAIAAKLTQLEAAALNDCCERGATRTNDGGIVDTILSGLCSNPNEGILNGWLITWAHNFPREPHDHYISRYTPTPLGLAVRAILQEQSQ